MKLGIDKFDGTAEIFCSTGSNNKARQSPDHNNTPYAANCFVPVDVASGSKL